MRSNDVIAIERLADRIRLRAVKMVAPHGFGYLGQALSSAEQIAALYSGPYRSETDQVVCSPGHYIIGFFAAAAEMGLLTDSELASYGQDGSALEAIGTERSPAVDLTCGSLGQGLSGGVGFALSHVMRGNDSSRVFVLLSDGELEEGQVWEAALFAAHNNLSNLTVLVDANDSQVDGPVSSITTLDPIADKWRSFGWNAFDVDGHDAEAVSEALAAAIEAEGPSVVIGRSSTVHGLDCLPDGADGHFIKLSQDLVDAAIAELEARLA